MDACITCKHVRRVSDVLTCSKQGKTVVALKLIGNRTDAARQLMERAAGSCGTLEQRAERNMPRAEAEQYLIGFPNMTATEEAPTSGDSRVGSCKSCLFGTPNSNISDNLICAVRGTLINPSKMVQVARECDTSKLNESTTTGAYRIDPLHELTGLGHVSVPSLTVSAPEAKPEPVKDPTEYESDKGLTEEDTQAGIRAWRKLVSPHNSQLHTFLPIFDPSFFSDEERSMIPRTGSDEHPENYLDHFEGVWSMGVLWQELDEVPALWGEAGTGKTEIGRHLAWLMQVPFYRFSITGRTELDDLAGKMHYHPEKGTYWNDGRFVRAYRRPGVILLDEPNAAPPEVWQFLRPVLDSSKQLVLDMNAGERVARHDSAYLMLAMNPAWDVRNLGVEQLADADTSRLTHIEVPFPPEKIEREIITERTRLDDAQISVENLDFIMRVAKDLRRLAQEGTLPISWGIRPQIQVARMLKWYSPAVAYRRAVGDALEPKVRELILDAVKAHTRSMKSW